jgi:hyaluronan synthase
VSKPKSTKLSPAGATDSAAAERFPAALASDPRRMLPRPLRGFATAFDERFIRLECAARPPQGPLRVSFSAPASMTAPHAGMNCDFPAELESVRDMGSGGCELTLKWAAPLSKLIDAAAASRRKRIGVLLFGFLGVVLWSRRSTLQEFWYEPMLTLYVVTIGSYFFSRFIFTLFHEYPPLGEHQPSVSVVISVRNDREAIAKTVASCLAADYPPDKREVLVVDDGSTDGTGEELLKLKRRIAGLGVFTIPPSGKRFAMAKGIREAKGEIIVVVDSDTLLDRMALRHIVCGFEDPSLGAVSGLTTVTNADKNLLTRMQDVRYLVSYELMKAPESLFGAVTCCPGCLSAYRREYLLDILEPWLHQTFLGTKATFGDDRSLTNYILRDYRVIYNPQARASTLVPENWGHYMRQQCRWKKSWLREAPIAGRILLQKHPVAALSFYASAVCSLTSPIVVLQYVWWGRSELVMGYLSGVLMLGMLLSLFALWRRPVKHWYVSWFWLATQVFLMAPQTYYAILTMRKNHWGTR